jgi:hypothetical protein
MVDQLFDNAIAMDKKIVVENDVVENAINAIIKERAQITMVCDLECAEITLCGEVQCYHVAEDDTNEIRRAATRECNQVIAIARQKCFALDRKIGTLKPKTTDAELALVVYEPDTPDSTEDLVSILLDINQLDSELTCNLSPILKKKAQWLQQLFGPSWDISTQKFISSVNREYFLHLLLSGVSRPTKTMAKKQSTGNAVELSREIMDSLLKIRNIYGNTTTGITVLKPDLSKYKSTWKALTLSNQRKVQSSGMLKFIQKLATEKEKIKILKLVIFIMNKG